MTQPTTHITTSGGLISAAFIDNIRELDTRQPGAAPLAFRHRRRPAHAVIPTGTERSVVKRRNLLSH
jgi:hypothetical protein